MPSSPCEFCPQHQTSPSRERAQAKREPTVTFRAAGRPGTTLGERPCAAPSHPQQKTSPPSETAQVAIGPVATVRIGGRDGTLRGTRVHGPRSAIGRRDANLSVVVDTEAPHVVPLGHDAGGCLLAGYANDGGVELGARGEGVRSKAQTMEEPSPSRHTGRERSHRGERPLLAPLKYCLHADPSGAVVVSRGACRLQPTRSGVTRTAESTLNFAATLPRRCLPTCWPPGQSRMRGMRPHRESS